MGSKFHRDVVVSNHHVKKVNDMIIYQKRELNMDGTWKEKSKTRNRLKEGMLSSDFHFLEYVGDTNIQNPLVVLQAGISRVGPQIERSMLNLNLPVERLELLPKKTHNKHGNPKNIKGLEQSDTLNV